MNKPSVRLTILFVSIAVLVFLRLQWVNYERGPSRQSAPVADCLWVDADLVDGIATGLTVGGGGSLDPMTARAVKSKDYANVYFIAAAIQGPGMGDGSQSIGVWASDSLTVGGGLIFAVDAFANEFSDWGDGGATSSQLSMADDGARAAKACVAAN